MKKNVLITGASSGIGYEFALVFAQAGYNLILVSRNDIALQELKERVERNFGINAYVVATDLSKEVEIHELYKWVNDSNISIHILINNAGFGEFGEFTSFEWMKQKELIQVNITALTELTHKFLPEMIEKGEGYVLNVASLGSFQPGPYISTYYASKAYVLSFTEALSVELKGTGVSIMALCPGPTKTPFFDRAGLKRRNIFRHLVNASPKKVAEYGYHMLMKRKVVAVHGVMNKMAVIVTKMLPRSWVRYFVSIIQK